MIRRTRPARTAGMALIIAQGQPVMRPKAQ